MKRSPGIASLLTLAAVLALCAPAAAAPACSAELRGSGPVELVAEGAGCVEAGAVVRDYASRAAGGLGCDRAAGNSCPLEVRGYRCQSATAAAYPLVVTCESDAGTISGFAMPAAAAPAEDAEVPDGDGPDVNGCGPRGAWGITGRLVPDRASFFDFRRACNRHDRCYARRGASRKRCDVAFLRDMRAACRRYRTIRRFACRRVAGAYYRAVRIGGALPFVRAQR